MWTTKDSQIAHFKVNILQERRWSIQGSNVQLIVEAELVNPSVLFAIVYSLPAHLSNKCIDKNTPPLLHVYGKHSKLGFNTHYNLLQHNYTLQHHQNLMALSSGSQSTKLFIPICGVAQQLQFVFTNITDKPTFNKNPKSSSLDELIQEIDDVDNNMPSKGRRRSGSSSVNGQRPNSSKEEDDDIEEEEDFGQIEIYGYSLQQIPAPRAAIPMLNLSSFFQFKSKTELSTNGLLQSDYQLLMTAAECDMMCAYVSIQSRYFIQAKELLTRSKTAWLKLYEGIISPDQPQDAGHCHSSFLRQIREKCNRFKYNALRVEILIAYIMNEHNNFKAQIQSIVNIIRHHTQWTLARNEHSEDPEDDLLPLQIISKYSRSLIKTLLLSAKDSNEFVQLASYKNICFIIEKLGCNIKEDLCQILSSIFEFDQRKKANSSDSGNVSNRSGVSSSRNSARRLQSKPLHIQSIIRQLIIVKHTICDSALNLISDCNFEIVETLFVDLLITNFPQIIRLESTKLAYCLRIFELCIDRLHCTPKMTCSILSNLVGLMYHSSKRVRNITVSIWRKFMSILPAQMVQTADPQRQNQICEWLCHMVETTEINRDVTFPQKVTKDDTKNNNNNHKPMVNRRLKSLNNSTMNSMNSMNGNGNGREERELNEVNDRHNLNGNNPLNRNDGIILLLQLPLNIINKSCEIQISWNERKSHFQSTDAFGLLAIKSDLDTLCGALKTRILKVLTTANEVEIYFDQFRMLLRSLDFISCAIGDYDIFDSLIMEVLNRFLFHLKSYSPSLMMLRICVEFMAYIHIPVVQSLNEKNENENENENLNENDSFESPEDGVLKEEGKFVPITLDIIRAFHHWIPHSVHDETFTLASKLIDINWMHLTHDDLCLIVRSLLSKYTLRSAVYQEFQQNLIAKIYQRIQNANNNGNRRDPQIPNSININSDDTGYDGNDSKMDDDSEHSPERIQNADQLELGQLADTLVLPESAVVTISEDMSMAERLMADDTSSNANHHGIRGNDGINGINNKMNEVLLSDDTDLFKLITSILIFDAAQFDDDDKMIRYLDFGYDWLQHQGFEGIYVDDFGEIFNEMISIFNDITAQCKNQQIVNISTDIVTSISLHFSTAINRYCSNDSELHDICDILIQMGCFYGNILQIDIGNVQFHSIQNITLFLHSIMLCSNKLKEKDNLYNECILYLLEHLFEIALSTHFTSITDLCLWTISNFYYEIARYGRFQINNIDHNGNGNGNEQSQNHDDNGSDQKEQENEREQRTERSVQSPKSPQSIMSEAISMDMNDTELITKFAAQMVQSRDHKIRKWCGMLLFLRFYFTVDSSCNLSRERLLSSDSFEKVSPKAVHNGKSQVNTAHDIYQQLLLDVDESVSEPLQTLCQMDDAEEIIQFIENSGLLHRPARLLSTNLENDVLIEGRSDTASINQVRIKLTDDNRFPGLLNMDESEIKIVDVDEVDDIEEVSDDDSDDDQVVTHHDEVQHHEHDHDDDDNEEEDDSAILQIVERHRRRLLEDNKENDSLKSNGGGITGMESQSLQRQGSSAELSSPSSDASSSSCSTSMENDNADIHNADHQHLNNLNVNGTSSDKMDTANDADTEENENDDHDDQGRIESGSSDEDIIGMRQNMQSMDRNRNRNMNMTPRDQRNNNRNNNNSHNDNDHSMSMSSSSNSTSSDDHYDPDPEHYSITKRSRRKNMKNNVVIPRLALDKIKEFNIQSNITSGSFGPNAPRSRPRGVRRDSLKVYEEMNINRNRERKQQRNEQEDDEDVENEEKMDFLEDLNTPRGDINATSVDVDVNGLDAERENVNDIDVNHANGDITGCSNDMSGRMRLTDSMEAMNQDDSGGSFGDEIDERGYDVDDEREESTEHIVVSIDTEQLEQLTLSPIESKKSSNQKRNGDVECMRNENKNENEDDMEEIQEMNAEEMELDEIIRNHEEKRRSHRRIIEQDIDPLDDDEDDENDDSEENKVKKKDIQSETVDTMNNSGTESMTNLKIKNQENIEDAVDDQEEFGNEEEDHDEEWLNTEIDETNPAISFKRGSGEFNQSTLDPERELNDIGADDLAERPDLKFIDSFLQSISNFSSSKPTPDLDALDMNDIAVDVGSPPEAEGIILDGPQQDDVDGNDDREFQGLTEEKLESFRKSNLKDYLVDPPKISNRKKGWWMKYLNSDFNNTSD